MTGKLAAGLSFVRCGFVLDRGRGRAGGGGGAAPDQWSLKGFMTGDNVKLLIITIINCFVQRPFLTDFTETDADAFKQTSVTYEHSLTGTALIHYFRKRVYYEEASGVLGLVVRMLMTQNGASCVAACSKLLVHQKKKRSLAEGFGADRSWFEQYPRIS